MRADRQQLPVPGSGGKKRPVPRRAARTRVASSGVRSTDRPDDVLALQNDAGNQAVAGSIAALQRRHSGGTVALAAGYDAAVPNFLDAFARYTSVANFAYTREPPQFPADETGDAKLDAALAAARRGMVVLTDPDSFAQVDAFAAMWEVSRPNVERALAWATMNEFPAADAHAGLARFEERLVQVQAATDVRAATEGEHVASATAGLFAEEDRKAGSELELAGRVYESVAQACESSKSNLKLVSAGLAVNGKVTSVDPEELGERLEKVKLAGTALSFVQLWAEGGTLDERLEAAKKRGLVAASATAGTFVAHAEEVGTEVVNMGLKQLQTMAEFQVEFWEGVGNEAMSAQWATRARNLGQWIKGLGAGASIVSIAAGVLNLIDAIQRDDVHGELAAGAEITQGAISLGGVIAGEGAAGATAMLSGAVVLVWAVIDTTFTAAELIRAFAKLQKLDAISHVLDVADSLIPWGKRMAGAADALGKVDWSGDLAHAQALADEMTRLAMPPFTVILEHLTDIGAAFDQMPDVPHMLGADGRGALGDAAGIANMWRAGDQVPPELITQLTDICARLYPALQRLGQWAVAKYGPKSDTPEAAAECRRFEAEVGAAA